MRVRISLKAKFLILLSLVLLIGGGATFYFIDKQITSYVYEGAKKEFQNDINSSAKDYFNLSAPTSLKLSDKYAEYVKDIDSEEDISDVKLLDSNGIVIHSNNATETGQSLIDSADVKSALLNEPSIVKVSDDSISIYAPIKSEANEIRGIVIANVLMAEDYAMLNTLRYEILTAIIVVSLILLIASYIIFSNADKELEEHERGTIDKSKALEEERQLDEAIMSSIAESLIVINRDGQIMLFNPEAERITGHRSVDVEYRLYKKIIRFCDKDGNEISKNPITDGLNTGEKIVVNINEGLFVKSAKNDLIPVSVSVSPITGKNNNVRGVVATIQDITAEKELDKVKDEFVYVVVHELGNPVFALDGYLSILQDKCKKGDKTSQRIIESARGVNQQLSGLINDLLEMVRSESGQLMIDVTPIDLTEIFERVLDTSKLKAKTKDIEIVYTKAKLPKVLGDGQKIREVAVNLLDNAIKYTPKGGRVEVYHEEDNKLITTHIKDNGIGMDKKSQENLFEKFYRVKSNATKGISGTGLGLFICRQIVEKCGGKIWAESEEGKGSTFSFSLKKSK